MFNILNEYVDEIYPDIEELRKINDDKLKKEKEIEIAKREAAKLAKNTDKKIEENNEIMKENTDQPQELNEAEITVTPPTNKIKTEEVKEISKSMDQLIAEEIKELK